MFIPALEANRRRRYVWYIGDKIQTASLWIQYAEKETGEKDLPDSYTMEFPIYANTRGKGIMFSADVDFGDPSQEEPTDAFWKALKQLGNDERDGSIEIAECEFYEQEFVQTVCDLWRQEKNTSEISTLISEARTELP